MLHIGSLLGFEKIKNYSIYGIGKIPKITINSFFRPKTSRKS
jgi:hypothetical protein